MLEWLYFGNKLTFTEIERIWILREKFVNVQSRLLLSITIVWHSDYNYRRLCYWTAHATLRRTMANLKWLLCLLRVTMYWDAHACNDVTDTSTECNIHLSYSDWRVAGCALSYRVVTLLPLCSRKVLLSKSWDNVISVGTPAIRHIHVKRARNNARDK